MIDCICNSSKALVYHKPWLLTYPFHLYVCHSYEINHHSRVHVESDGGGERKVINHPGINADQMGGEKKGKRNASFRDAPNVSQCKKTQK